jgi:LPXTG-motif cell wall-anchored protein
VGLRRLAAAAEAHSDFDCVVPEFADAARRFGLGCRAPARGEDTNGSGGGLPVTGAAAGTIAGAAALLLVVGAVLFVMSRRRKVKFTA